MLVVNRALKSFAILAALSIVGLGASARAHDPNPYRARAADPPLVGSLFERTPEFDYEPPEPGTYELPALRQAGDGAVLDSTGARHRLGDVFKGKIVLLSLIYTLCSDSKGCPLATATLYDIFNASARDPELARNLRIVSLSFDPERDTPAAIAAYAAPIKAAPNAGRKSDWVFLTTESEKTLAPILDGYDQMVTRGVDPDRASASTLEHILHVYLIDRAGQVRNIYTLSFLDPRLIVADVKTLLLEGRRTAHQ
jgi:protein SCO1/2